MIKQVSKVLLKPTEKLTIKLSVGLLDSNNRENFYNLFEGNPWDYLTMNISSNILMQYKMEGPWDRNQTIHINDGNIFYWNKRLQAFYATLQKPDLFIYYTSGKIEYNGDESYNETIALKGGEFVELEPGVIFDTKGHPLPGIFMRLNIKSNVVELSFDEFESMMYKFAQVNIGAEGMQLILAHLLLEKRIEEGKKRDMGNAYVPPKPVFSIFQSKEEVILPEEKETIVDNRIPPKTEIHSLDDL